MELLFNSEDIEKWAAFSGDRNPIHFDRQAAAKLGVEKVVVHGMLTLLPVKQEMASKSEADPSSWTQFRASFKSPTLIDEKVFLKTKERRAKQTFRVSSSNEEYQCFVGNISQVKPEVWASREEVNYIDEEDIKRKFDKFYCDFEQQFDYWIWLDGLVFGHFICNQIGNVFSELKHISTNNKMVNSIDNLSDYLIVQISHQTTFSSDLKNTPIQLHEIPDICYQVDNFNITEDSEAAFGTCEIGVMVNEQHQMTLELGLMIKMNTQQDIEYIN